MTVPLARAEEARAVMLELFPKGFEELDAVGSVELAAYTDAGGEERLWQAFGSAQTAEVPEDWEDRWRRFHRPVQVGPLWVGPPWEQPDEELLPVVIEPGRAFGTGGHPTTRLCLELLLEVPRGSLLDIGCGSGVLSIAAARLGFAPVTAVDHEEQAVEATAANAAANAVEVEARLADALADELPRADVALANIALEQVEALAPRLDCRRLVTSGYLVSELPRPAGWRHAARREDGGWAADAFERAK